VAAASDVPLGVPPDPGPENWTPVRASSIYAEGQGRLGSNRETQPDASLFRCFEESPFLFEFNGACGTAGRRRTTGRSNLTKTS